MDLSQMTVPAFFEQAAGADPDAPFLIWTQDGATTSYSEARTLIDRAAAVWHRLGVRRGDRVCFMLDNCPEFVWAWLGLARAGGVLVAVNTGFRAGEAGYLARNSASRLALVGEEHLPVMRTVMDDTEVLQRLLTPGSGPDGFADLMAAEQGGAPEIELSGDDLVSLIYTSGTTGDPKGVMQTHRNFVLTGQAYGYWMQMKAGERIYACLPLFHINSQAYSTMGAIGLVGALVLSPRFSASRFWPEVRQHSVNVFNFIGAMTVILSKKEPGPDDGDNAVHTAYGVPALAPELVESVQDRFGLRVISGFGMSETTFGLLEPSDEPRRPGSMGRPRHHPDPSVPRTEAKIVDDEGAEAPRGRAGELLLRNAAMMAGYFRDEERTAEALRDGWLHTGDTAYQDEDGFFFFVDRKKDIVRRRGENVSSIEVERTIERHPDVQEAAVIGVPSELSDEDLLVFVVPRTGADADPHAVFAWAADNLAPFKVPNFVRYIDTLPKTPTSKIQKTILREIDAGDAAGRIAREG